MRQELLFGKKKEAPPKMFTEEKCANCGDKILRSFLDGDFVYKTTESKCSKCSSASIMISGVFGQYALKTEKDQS